MSPRHLHLDRGPLDKARGAYYTEQRVAAALCRWALRERGDKVLDPAFGGGVFLQAAAARVAALGGGAVHGVELDSATYAGTAARVSATCAGTGAMIRSAEFGRLVQADFFALSPGDLPPVDAVVGNPPFIRFQRFSGEARTRAVDRAREAGIEVGPLAGSWVAFVAHATSFLAPGGRLALVVPAELGHAPYARPLLELLGRDFASTTIVTFDRSLFPHLDQETVLLLGDGHGAGPGGFSALELGGAEALEQPLPCTGDRPLDGEALVSGRSSLAHSHLESAARSLYRDLPSRGALRLGDIAKVESGYVSGANSYFHLTPQAAVDAGLPSEVLVPAVFRSRALAGLSLSGDDWQAAGSDGGAGYLVQAHGHDQHPAVAAFLRRLEKGGVPLRYKARHRAVWHRVPRVVAAPLLLAAMGGHGLRMAVNDAGLAAPNTFHLVTPHMAPKSGRLQRLRLAAACLTSLTALSTELEGHALGGGMLKCDPGEAGQLLLPPPSPLPAACLERLDRLLRGGEREAARREADRLLLAGILGLTDKEITCLADAAAKLAARRQSRA